MNLGFALGRVALVVIFLVSGAEKLLDITGTANDLAKIVLPFAVPSAVNDLIAQLVATVQMPFPQILAIVAGVVEVVAAILIAFNILTRTSAVVLLLYTIVATLLIHAFWTMEGADRAANLAHALKNLSIIGALLMLASLPRRWGAEARDADHLGTY